MLVRIFSVSDCGQYMHCARVGETVVAMTCAAGEAYGEKPWLLVDIRSKKADNIYREHAIQQERPD